MRTLSDIIIKIGLENDVDIAQLFSCAEVCIDDPTRGFKTVLIEHAPLVIKDCAKMTVKYLSIEVYDNIRNSIIDLLREKNITNNEVDAFVADEVNRPLLLMIIEDGHDYIKVESKQTVKKSFNVYGNYDSGEAVVDTTELSNIDKLKSILVV